MQAGLSLVELAHKIESQAALKKDFIAPTKQTRLVSATPDGKEQSLYLEDQGEYPLQPLAHRQLATFTDIPAKYYDRMMEEAPELLQRNVNEWLGRSDKSRMVRTMGGNARAYLSNSYQRVDYIDVAKVALPVLMNELKEVQIVSSQVTDSRLYIHYTLPSVAGEVKVGDIVQAGGIISDSEVGLGSVSASVLLWRLRCLNGLKTQDVYRKTHVGRAVEDSEALWAEDTIAADDRAVLLKVRDMVRAATDLTRFQHHLTKLKGLTEGKITGNPAKAVEVLSNKLGISEGEQGGILTSLFEGGDMSRWGIVNAVTAQAHKARDYDRSVEFEGMGGQLIDLPKDQWQTILEAA